MIEVGENFAALLIAIASTVGTVMTMFASKRQNSVITEIDKKTKDKDIFLEKEKTLKNKILLAEKDRNKITQEIMMLILDTNLHIYAGDDKFNEETYNQALDQSQSMKDQYIEISKYIADLNKEYELILNISSEFKESAGVSSAD